MTQAQLAELPTYALFARSARYAMQDAVRWQRRALREPEEWFAGWQLARAERIRGAAWSHLAAARKARAAA